MTPQDEQRYEQRFDRIEGKLDKLVEIVSSLARVEEQLVAQNRRVDTLEHRVEKNTTDIDHIATLSRNNGVVIRAIDKAFWIILAAVASVGVYFITH